MSRRRCLGHPSILPVHADRLLLGTNAFPRPDAPVLQPFLAFDCPLTKKSGKYTAERLFPRQKGLAGVSGRGESKSDRGRRHFVGHLLISTARWTHFVAVGNPRGIMTVLLLQRSSDSGKCRRRRMCCVLGPTGILTRATWEQSKLGHFKRGDERCRGSQLWQRYLTASNHRSVHLRTHPQEALAIHHASSDK